MPIKYFDNASTTKIDSRVLEAMSPYLNNFFGNASSNHEFGKKAKNSIEKARTQVAELINSHDDEIIFTSGSTESINLALKGFIESNYEKGNHIITCVDKNSTRKLITDYLVSIGISFSDVGLGVNIVDQKLTGAVRVTSATGVKNDHLSYRIFPEDSDNNEYGTNIQIAELNALNAIFAILKWKKISGIYVDLENEHHSSYSIGVSKIFNEDATTT